MTPLGEKFNKVTNTINNMSLRERLLLVVASVVVLYLAWNLFLFKPLQREGKEITNRIAEVQQDVARMEAEVQGFRDVFEHDPDVQNKVRTQAVEKEIEQLNSRIQQLAEVMIEPEQMVKLLEELLQREQNLRLVKLENIEPRPFIETPETEGVVASTGGVNLYQHGFAIEFEGDFHSTLSYLRELEKLPWRFFWDGVTFDVQEYPRARVRIELHTLGLTEGWIGV
jgi:MSHA biogenesis protein MshJ